MLATNNTWYFGDSNMQRDKFLQDEVAKDTEGWVPLTTMLKVFINIKKYF